MYGFLSARCEKKRSQETGKIQETIMITVLSVRESSDAAQRLGDDQGGTGSGSPMPVPSPVCCMRVPQRENGDGAKASVYDSSSCFGTICTLCRKPSSLTRHIDKFSVPSCKSSNRTGECECVLSSSLLQLLVCKTYSVSFRKLSAPD